MRVHNYFGRDINIVTEPRPFDIGDIFINLDGDIFIFDKYRNFRKLVNDHSPATIRKPLFDNPDIHGRNNVGISIGTEWFAADGNLWKYHGNGYWRWESADGRYLDRHCTSSAWPEGNRPPAEN